MDPKKTEIILGPPGTGKTHSLLSLIEESIAKGTDPRKIAFISFTNKAADEGRSRAIERFEIDPDDLPYFRTLHSLAFKQTGMKRKEVLGRRHILDFGKIIGLDFQGAVEEDTRSMSIPDRMLFLENLSRNRMTDLKEEWIRADDHEVSWIDLLRTKQLYEKFKKTRGLYDFTDMLELFLSDDRSWTPDLDLVVIDEAQDLSKLQWACVSKVTRKAKRIIIGGDDDQAIYQWSGADIDSFIDLTGEITILHQSWRVPSSVQSVANKISKGISRRKDKEWKSRSCEGSVSWAQDFSNLPLDSGRWLLLARNGYSLKDMEDFCLSSGFPFEGPGRSPLKGDSLKAIVSWEDLRSGKRILMSDLATVVKFLSDRAVSDKLKTALRELADEPFLISSEEVKERFSLDCSRIWHETLTKMSSVDIAFFLAARKKGEKLLSAPRITLSTIHSAKGGERENVAVVTDISKRCFDSLETKEGLDAELRVFYVAVTRCRDNLFLMEPKTDLSFEMLR